MMDKITVRQDGGGQWWVTFPLEADGSGGVSLPVSESVAALWIERIG